jgi:hypothetical protein
MPTTLPYQTRSRKGRSLGSRNSKAQRRHETVECRWRSSLTAPRGNAAGVKESKARQVRFEGALGHGAWRLGLARLASVRLNPSTRQAGQAYKLPRPPTRYDGRQTLPDHGRQGSAGRQSPHGRQIQPTIESMTGRRPSSSGSKMHGSLGCGWCAPQTALVTNGPFLLRTWPSWDCACRVGGRADERWNFRDARVLSHASRDGCGLTICVGSATWPRCSANVAEFHSAAGFQRLLKH